jgi:hypothetical protein
LAKRASLSFVDSPKQVRAILSLLAKTSVAAALENSTVVEISDVGCKVLRAFSRNDQLDCFVHC